MLYFRNDHPSHLIGRGCKLTAAFIWRLSLAVTHYSTSFSSSDYTGVSVPLNAMTSAWHAFPIDFGKRQNIGILIIYCSSEPLKTGNAVLISCDVPCCKHSCQSHVCHTCNSNIMSCQIHSCFSLSMHVHNYVATV